MFNWLGNLFPYSDLHSLNLDWILSKMKETAAQAAKAVADAANALAQVAEAKAAALSAQTAAENAQTAANNAQTAANNAADSAENAVTVAQSAQTAAQSAKTAAQNAQNTANTAQTAAQSAQETATSAKTAAQNAQNTANAAQTAADSAQNTANSVNDKFPIKTEDIFDSAVTNEKIAIDISGNKIAKRSMSAECISFESIKSGFVSSPKVDNITLRTISNSEIEFYFSVVTTFVDSTAAFVRLLKPKSAAIANEKTYIVTSPFPASRKANSASFNCERYLVIGDIFDNNDNLLGTCIINATTSYGSRDDGSTGWSGKLKLLYCDTATNFANMTGQLGISSVKLTNLY